MMDGHYWGMGWGIWLFPLLFIVGFFLIMRNTMRPGPTLSAETPLDMLKRRYASGELSREQFEQMKQDI